VQNHAKWRFGWKKKLLRKGLNFSMWASFRLRNIALKFFSPGCSFFSRLNVCKKRLCYDKPSWSVFFFTCLLNRKQANCLQCTKSKSIDQFRYIKIQPETIDLSTRLWGINTEFVGFIPQSLVLRSIVLGWILIYRNWSILRAYRSGDLGTDFLHRLLWCETQRANRSSVKRNTIEERGDVMR